MSLETVPKELRHLRACLLCSLVKTFEQFEYDGCENCEDFLHMKNNKDAVHECTSSNFDGIIALTSPEDSWVAKWQRIKDSWVAKWQRINHNVKGCYAVSVTGRLPSGVISDLKAKGIPYRSRDTSAR